MELKKPQVPKAVNVTPAREKELKRTLCSVKSRNAILVEDMDLLLSTHASKSPS